MLAFRCIAFGAVIRSALALALFGAGGAASAEAQESYAIAMHGARFSNELLLCQRAPIVRSAWLSGNCLPDADRGITPAVAGPNHACNPSLRRPPRLRLGTA